MSYIKITFPDSTQEQNELIVAVLGEIDFDTFDESEEGLNAYSEFAKFDENKLIQDLQSIEILKEIQYHKTIINKINWNEEWEKNFPPLIINSNWSVRAHFHQSQNTLNEILITPKMSFGTGHHATTAMVMQLMDDENFNQKSVFDFGSGTGILAIMAEKKGASKICANDIEEWAHENAIENAANNHCSKIQFYLGGIDVVPQYTFDIIIANINKNVISSSIAKMIELSHKDTVFFISGILLSDEADIVNTFAQYQYFAHTKLSKDSWLAVKFIKL